MEVHVVLAAERHASPVWSLQGEPVALLVVGVYGTVTLRAL